VTEDCCFDVFVGRSSAEKFVEAEGAIQLAVDEELLAAAVIGVIEE
jgi:hypothetical protein